MKTTLISQAVKDRIDHIAGNLGQVAAPSREDVLLLLQALDTQETQYRHEQLQISLQLGSDSELIEELESHSATLYGQLEALRAEHAELHEDWQSLLQLAEELRDQNGDLRRMGDVVPGPGMSAQVLHLAYPSHLTGEQLAEVLGDIRLATDKALGKYRDEKGGVAG